MTHYDWDDAKNAKLMAERGIGFEEIVFHIERGDLLGKVRDHSPAQPAGTARRAPSQDL